MLLLLQAAAQQIPPIHVAVQQPPGSPFWETAIISAVVGTFFGIASGIAMEFVKPVIAKGLSKKVILKNLDDEFRVNYASYLDAVQIAKDYDGTTAEGKERAALVLASIGGSLSKDRFTYFKEKEKVLFYEADEGYRLAKFYMLFELGCRDFPVSRTLLRIAGEVGRGYIKARRLPEIRPLGYYLEAWRC